MTIINKYQLIIIIVLMISNILSSQINPPNNAKLNYIQVMFEYPEIKNAAYYIVKITNFPDSANRNETTIEQTDKTTATLINGLKFGTKYHWIYIAYNKNGEIIYKSNPFYFETLTSKYIDNNLFKFTINKKEVNDGIIFNDSKTAINRYGKPIWFYPLEKNGISDLKMTKSGTLTFISNINAGKRDVYTGLEISINGDTLWESPNNGTVSGDTTEYLHHQFDKLDNGNYLVLGKKHVNSKQKINADKICFGTIIEYDSKGNVLWNWDSEKHIADTDVYFPSNKIPTYDLNGFKIYDFMHTNGFYFDKKNDIIYLSCQVPSRLIKIDKKSGKVINNYGDYYPSGEVKNANNFFKYQHSPLVLPNGNIAAYSNNSIGEKDTNKTSAFIIVFSEPNKRKSSKIIWKFKCNFDTLYGSNSYGRGNIIYFNNTNFLVNMGSPVSRFFEVTKRNKIVWDCYLEKLSRNDNKWIPACSSRISYAKSLYPVYFTLTNSFNPDTIKIKETNEISFNINNEGSSSDSYTIHYIVNDKECKTINTNNILPEQTKIISIKTKELSKYISKESKTITIIVNSSANQKIKREIKMVLK